MPTLPPCPQCEAPMRARRGSKGAFLGCTRYPECRGSRPMPADAPDSPSEAPARPEAPGVGGDLITDLRRAAGYIGAAVDVLRRRQPELEALLAPRNEPVPF
jgi:ssDNA-binding Zn-finger/Zn-ribbon topoisomerase 1